MLACLASACHGRLVPSSAQQLRIDLPQVLHPLESFTGAQKSTQIAAHNLAMFLLAFKTAAAFNPSSPMLRNPVGRYFTKIHVGQRMPAVTMQDDKETFAEDSSGAKEFFEESEEKKIEDFENASAAAGEVARSPEAIAAKVALAEAAAAALQGNSEIAAVLEKKKSPSGKLAKELRKPAGSMALIGEAVNTDGLATLGGCDLNDPVYLSKEFREGGASAVFARSLYEDSCGEDTLKATVAEQETALDYPPPLPVVARMPVVDPLQLAQASLEGATGAVISLSVAGKEKTAELMAAAEGLGMESLIRVTSAEELSTALELGAKIVVIGDMSLPQAAPLLESIPKGKDSVVTVADLRYSEVAGAWRLREAGFNALIVGRPLVEQASYDRIPPQEIIKAYRKKGNPNFGATGFQLGRGEGSKENLGQLMM